MGNSPDAADRLAASDNIAQSEGLATTPDSRHATPAKTPYPPLPIPKEPTWPLLYGIVLAELAILIVAFYAFTKAFA